MINSEQKRRLIADYGDPLDARAAVARSIAGLLMIVLIALIATSPEDTYDSSAKADAAKGGAKGAAAISEKRVATSR